MVITITPVSPSACLPGDKGQFQESLSSLCLLWLLQPLWTDASHLQTTFSNYSFSILLHFHLCPQNKKKKPQQTGEAKPRQINQIFLMLSQTLLQRSLPATSEKSNFPKEKEPNEGNCKVKKRQLFHPAVSKKHFQCSSTLVLCLTALSRERGRERIGSEPITWDSSQEHRQTMGWTRRWSQRMKKSLE